MEQNNNEQNTPVLQNELGGMPNIDLPGPVLFALDVLIQAVNIAQEKGAYTIGDAGKICSAIDAVRPFLPKE